MIAGPRPPHFPDRDGAAPVPLAVKDGLRGLRQRLSEWPSTFLPSPEADLPLSPLALAARLLRETGRMAAFGEDIARDVLLHHRDEGRIKAFARSGFGQALSPKGDDRRHGFVSSRYAASKIALAHFGYPKRLVLEQPIDTVWRKLSAQYSPHALADGPSDPFEYHRVAATALALMNSGAITDHGTDQGQPTLAALVYTTLGLAEAVLALTPDKGNETTLAALAISADIVALRSANLVAILGGFDPESHLAAEFQLLAPPLAES